MKIKNQILSFIILALVAVTTFSCSTDNTDAIVPLKSIMDIAKSDSNFTALVAAIQKTGLDSATSSPLSSAGSYTVFAPTNVAFAALPITQLQTAASISALDPVVDAGLIATLKLILQNHILGIGTKADDLIVNTATGITGYSKTFAYYKATPTATSGANLSMFVNKVGSDVLVNGGASNGGAKVTTADIPASNGFIHVIDHVLSLPTIVSQVIANPDFSSLLSVVTSVSGGTYGNQAPVLGVLAGATAGASTALTVYAPVNTAFATALGAGGSLTGSFFATPALTETNIAKVLKYHVQTNNFPASSATSYTSATATTDQIVTTLLTQKFTILKGTVKVTELPVITVPASNMKIVNIQASNGVIFAMDRVLQPVL